MVGWRVSPFLSSRALTALCISYAGLLVPTLARAQAGPLAAPPAAAEPPSTMSEAGQRIRFGIGGELGWFGAPGNGVVSLGAVGLYSRLGVQVNDRIGVHITGAASSILLRNYVRGALIVDVSPVRFFSIGTGFTTAATFSIFPGNSPTEGKGTFLGVPLALSLYTKGDESRPEFRHGTGVTLTFNAGYAELERQGFREYEGFGGSVTLSIGYEQR